MHEAVGMHETDPEMEQAIQADQRRIYKGPARYDCPDCGKKRALTAEMKRRGYHCDACNQQAEGGGY